MLFALIFAMIFIVVLGAMPVLLVVFCIYYEIRRARRIRLGLPLEGNSAQESPPGFEVELKNPPSA